MKLITTLGATVLLLGGCGGSEPPSTTSTDPDADPAVTLSQIVKVDPAKDDGDEGDEVERDPFEVDFDAQDQDDDEEPDTAALDAELLQRVEDARAKLALRSVMRGSVPLANINGKVYRVGDVMTVDEVRFQVVEIVEKEVKLVAVNPRWGTTTEVETSIALVQ